MVQQISRNKENIEEFSNWHSRRKWRHITSHGTRYNFVIKKHNTYTRKNTTKNKYMLLQILLFIKVLTLNKNSKENHPKTLRTDDKALHSPFAKPD
jgi:hypothetical protein